MWLNCDISLCSGALSIGIVSDKLLSARAVLIVPMLLIGVPVVSSHLCLDM